MSSIRARVRAKRVQRRVLLPEPLGPTTATVEPAGMVRLTWLGLDRVRVRVRVRVGVRVGVRLGVGAGVRVWVRIRVRLGLG